MLHKYQVAVYRTDDIAGAVARGIDSLGGIERYVWPGSEVVVKVNMFTRATAESGKVTHPAVVLAVARMCHACGAHVSVIERHAHYAHDFQEYYAAIQQVADLISLEEVEHRHIYLPGARSLLCQVPWPTLIDACDLFINIPGLRMHALPKMSNGMKNLMGLLPDDATRLVHHYGLDGSICDLNYYRPSDLVITEAVYTLEGNFPSEGSPVKTDIITVADNVVAADLVGAKMLGIDPMEVYHLQEAIGRGMGPSSLDEIDLLGDPLEELLSERSLVHAPREPEPHVGQHRLSIENACQSCRQALAGGLLAASHRPELDDLESVRIIAGHQDREPSIDDGKVPIYGNCAYRYRDLGRYEPGCPPLAGQVRSGLTELKPRAIRPSMCSIAWRDDPIEGVVPIVADAGYVGLEAWGPHLERYAQEHGDLASLADLLRERQLTVPMISAYFDLTGDREQALALGRRYMDYARALDAPLIRVFTGGGDSEQASISTWRAVVEGLRKLCQIGLESGVGLALETHAGHLHNTTDSTLRLIRQTGLPNLFVNLDIFNLFARGEDPVGAFRRLLPWTRILHLKNSVRVGERWRSGSSLAGGAMDYGPFLQALAGGNFDGYVSIEWFGDNPDAAAVTELEYLRGQLGRRLEARPS